MHLHIATVACFLAVLVVQAAGQDAPVIGQMSGVTENSSLSYVCNEDGGGLHCHFVEVLISKATPPTVEQADEMVRQYLARPFNAKTCGAMKEFLYKLEAGTLPDGMTEAQAGDAKVMVQGFAEICDRPTEQAARQLVALISAKQAKTCSIGTLPFDLDFTFNGSTSRWESLSAPQGPCGTVTAAHMEKDAVSGSSFWNYGQQRLVTKKDAENEFGTSCSEVSEAQVKYQWQEREMHLQCIYVKFGLIP